MSGNPKALPAARDDLARAQEYLARACTRLRETGWTDTADDLARELAILRTYSKTPNGILAQLEAAPDWPDDWPEGSRGKMLRETEGVEPWRQT